MLSAVSDVSLRFSDVLFDVVLLANNSAFKDKFCSVSFVSLIINLSFISLSDKICSVSEALLANDSLSEFE